MGSAAPSGQCPNEFLPEPSKFGAEGLDLPSGRWLNEFLMKYMHFRFQERKSIKIHIEILRFLMYIIIIRKW